MPQMLQTVRRWRSRTDRSRPGREAPKALAVSVKVLDQGIRAYISTAPDASSDGKAIYSARTPNIRKHVIEGAPSSFVAARRTA